MKIKLFYAGVFLTTLIFGYIAVFTLNLLSKPPISVKEECVITVSTIQSDLSVRPDLTDELEVIKTDGKGWIYQEEYQFRIRLIETGEGFHGTEIPAKNGEKWLGLFNDDGKMSLRSTRVNITRVHDGIVDDNTKLKTGKDVSVVEKSDPMFLLKNADKLKEGSVKTFFTGMTSNQMLEEGNSNLSTEDVLTTLKPGFLQTYEINDVKYALKVIEAKTQRGEKILALVMESNGKRQIIHAIDANLNSTIGFLYWAGDLDRDGKPDLYLELYEHENVVNKVLFLSSAPGKGEFVNIGAYFWITGC